MSIVRKLASDCCRDLICAVRCGSSRFSFPLLWALDCVASLADVESGEASGKRRGEGAAEQERSKQHDNTATRERGASLQAAARSRSSLAMYPVCLR